MLDGELLVRRETRVDLFFVIAVVEYFGRASKFLVTKCELVSW